MADTKRKKAERHTTPTGTLKYAWLLKPDTKFDKDNKGGYYKATLVLEGPTGESLLTKLQAEHNKAVEKINAERKVAGKGKVKKIGDLPIAQDEESGNYEVKFKLPAKWESKKTGEKGDNKVALFQKNGQPLAKDVKIGNGSKAQVSYEIRPYDSPAFGAGISLRLLAVRFIELVEWSGGSADSYGFDTSDADEDEESSSEETTTTTSGGDEEEETDF